MTHSFPTRLSSVLMIDLKQPKCFFTLTRPAEHYNVYLWREPLEYHFKFLSIKYRHAKKIDDCHFSERVIMDEMLWCLVEVSQVLKQIESDENNVQTLRN